jgi:hypothetical protein
MGQTFAPWSYTSFKNAVCNALIVVSPCVAGVIASEWNKDRVRLYMYDNVKMTAEFAKHCATMSSTPTFSFEHLVKEGILPPEYTASTDPERLVNVFIKPEMIGILVAGDPGRNQSRAYMGNHIQGPPTSRRIALPRDWKRLIERRG